MKGWIGGCDPEDEGAEGWFVMLVAKFKVGDLVSVDKVKGIAFGAIDSEISLMCAGVSQHG